MKNELNLVGDELINDRGRKDFIERTASGAYIGVDLVGDHFTVYVEQGASMTIKFGKEEKGQSVLCRDYNVDGELVMTYVEGF